MEADISDVQGGTTPNTMTIASDACESSPIQFRFEDELYELHPGQKRTFRID